MIPYLNEKIHSRGIVSPTDILLMNNKVKSLEEIPKAPRCCILSPSKKVRQILEDKLGKKIIDGPTIMKPVGMFDDKSVFSVSIGFGAPMWIWAMEQLVAWGVKEFIYIAWFGATNNRVDMNKLQVAERALCDEGTSYHYGFNSKWAYPDKELTAKLLKNDLTQPVTVWTMDAMFMETRAEAEYAAKNNIDGFDMETSALMNFAKLKDVKMAVVLLAVDSFIKGKYANTYKSQNFDSQVLSATQLALSALDQRH